MVWVASATYMVSERASLLGLLDRCLDARLDLGLVAIQQRLLAHEAVVVEALLQGGADRQVDAVFELEGLPQQVCTRVPEGLGGEKGKERAVTYAGKDKGEVGQVGVRNTWMA